MADKFCGVSGMVRAALWFEDRLGLETLNIGREALQRRDSCTLQTCGRYLFYSITIDGGFVFLDVSPMDRAIGASERLLTIGDTKQGWFDLCRLVQALERNQIRDVKVRPLEIGESGNRDSWVIGD
jgi:hypothetical protein